MPSDRCPHTSVARTLARLTGVGVAVLLAQPSTARAQAVPNLTIAMSHIGNFTLGMPGVYTIVVSNIGGTASSGPIVVSILFTNRPNTTSFDGSATGNSWSCSVTGGIPNPFIAVTCASTSVIAAGGSASPITLTVIPGGVSGTVTNTATVGYPCVGTICTNYQSVGDVTTVVSAVPTLPEWAMIVLTGLLVLAGVVALRRRPT